jgi:CheY-like chemotaxis protein
MQKTILLVEDSQDDQLFFRRILKKCGVMNRLVTVTDGNFALAYLRGDSPFDNRRQHPLPRVVFLDLRMPNCDGFEVLSWIQSQPDLKKKMLIIVMSGLDGVADVHRAYQLGADTFLSKPFTPSDMLHLINTFHGHWVRTAPAATIRPWQHLDAEPDPARNHKPQAVVTDTPQPSL